MKTSTARFRIFFILAFEAARTFAFVTHRAPAKTAAQKSLSTEADRRASRYHIVGSKVR